jgi:hypothetical protein
MSSDKLFYAGMRIVAQYAKHNRVQSQLTGKWYDLLHFRDALSNIAQNEIPVQQNGSAPKYIKVFTDLCGIETLAHRAKSFILGRFDTQ